MSCKNGCQVSHSKKARVHEPSIKCICKSVPFKLKELGPHPGDPTEPFFFDTTIFENPQHLPNTGLYTVLNFTDRDMHVEFHVKNRPFPFIKIIPGGGSVTMQLENLTKIEVKHEWYDWENDDNFNKNDDEDGRLDFEICFPVDF